ncbi:hypothetical protein ACB092_05G255100 [Castanea dentata]
MYRYLLLLLFSLVFPICISFETITQNQPLKDGQILVSYQKTFALGFFTPTNFNHRYIGIWYNQITKQTVVWFANRDNPLYDKSRVLSINGQGNLVLHTQNQSIPIWSTNVSTSASPTNNSMAKLLEVRNLVLLQQDNQKVILWQSFDYPTNTILPFMKLGLDLWTGLNRYLTSWKSKDDPGTGNYSYRIVTIGYPQLILYMDQTPLWRVGSWTGLRWSGVPKMAPIYPFNASYVNNQDEITIAYGLIDPKVFSKMVVESGTMQLSTWHETRWVEYWSGPQEACDKYLGCGPNSYCDPYNGDTFECTCLLGLEPKSPRDWHLRDASGGCVSKECLHAIMEKDTSIARVDMSLSLIECEQQCLRNCSCMAYASANESEGGFRCLTWHGNLVDTRTYFDTGQDLYIRVDAVVLAKRQSTDSSLPNFKDSPSRSEFDGSKSNSKFPVYDLKTIIAATNNFSAANELGKGGFGSVYKGLLQNKMEIAVKRLSKHTVQGVEQFKNEVALIAKLQHRNLVRILDETKRSCLDWRKRFEIICGIARSILYLHQDSRLRIIHRDLKASNILLDNALNPKISDFGMARIVGGDQIEVNTNHVVGTYGYMSPEYAMQGIFSIKSDVYSFGVLLLEIIVGKKNGTYYHDGPSPYLNEHVWDLWREGKVMEIVDASLGETYPANEVLRCIQIGLLCVQEHATDRPTMLTVVFMLGNDIPLPSPKQPAFISTSTNNNRDMLTSVNEISISEIDGR